jgi:hypothetical protein
MSEVTREQIAQAIETCATCRTPYRAHLLASPPHNYNRSHEFSADRILALFAPERAALRAEVATLDRELRVLGDRAQEIAKLQADVAALREDNAAQLGRINDYVLDNVRLREERDVHKEDAALLRNELIALRAQLADAERERVVFATALLEVREAMYERFGCRCERGVWICPLHLTFTEPDPQDVATPTKAPSDG